MKQRRRRTILLAAAAAHLGLAATGAIDLCLWESGPIGQALTVYAALAGVDSGYAYFAPSVAAPLHTRFTIEGADGRTTIDTLETRLTREADIRVEDLTEVIQSSRADRAVRRQIMASWAAVIFARHRGAERVVIDVGRERVPSMAALRRGARPRWRSDYRARVVRPHAPREQGGGR